MISLKSKVFLSEIATVTESVTVVLYAVVTGTGERSSLSTEVGRRGAAERLPDGQPGLSAFGGDGATRRVTHNSVAHALGEFRWVGVNV